VKDFDKVASAFKTFLANHPVEGTLEENGKSVKINIVGKSAHAMEPNNGVNAGLHLVAFLGKFKLTGAANDFVTFG
ncbi:dipeptidase PepV, partial [Staphylococcus aureus]